MTIQILGYTPEWEPAVARFSQRMLAAKAPVDFGLPTRAQMTADDDVAPRFVLAVDGTEVRGGMIVQEHPGVLHAASDGPAPAAEITVANLQSPLSEGIIDPQFAGIAIRLLRYAARRTPYLYAVGMGGEQNPFARLLVAAGWSVTQVPFFFRILRAGRCVRELRPLQQRPALRVLARVAAQTGTAALALGFAQRQRSRQTGLRATLAATDSYDASDELIWESVRKRLSFAVSRDDAMLKKWLDTRVRRYRVHRGADAVGWFSVLATPMHAHHYFGSLRVATLVDVLARDPRDLAEICALATNTARADNCDMIVTNQTHHEHQAALREAGYLSYRSNYLLATSKPLSAAMDAGTSLVTRQDGDGLVHL